MSWQMGFEVQYLKMSNDADSQIYKTTWKILHIK